MSVECTGHVNWKPAEVASPQLAQRVPVVVAENLPYFPDANRFQNLSIYLPTTPETPKLVGTTAERLPAANPDSAVPRYHVHIHGGAIRR